MRRRIAILAGMFGTVAVAAGGSLAASPKEPTCVPEGNAPTISANDVRFNKDCLVAPADEAFTIAFDNQEVEPHNVSIYDKANGNKALFKGEIFLGPRTVTYSVPPLPEGNYVFLCDPHDDAMRGLFVVGNPPRDLDDDRRAADDHDHRPAVAAAGLLTGCAATGRDGGS